MVQPLMDTHTLLPFQPLLRWTRYLLTTRFNTCRHYNVRTYVWLLSSMLPRLQVKGHEQVAASGGAWLPSLYSFLSEDTRRLFKKKAPVQRGRHVSAPSSRKRAQLRCRSVNRHHGFFKKLFSLSGPALSGHVDVHRKPYLSPSFPCLWLLSVCVPRCLLIGRL